MLIFIKFAAQGSRSPSNGQRFCLRTRREVGGDGPCEWEGQVTFLCWLQYFSGIGGGGTTGAGGRRGQTSGRGRERGRSFGPFSQVDNFGDTGKGMTQISPTCHEVGFCHWCTPCQLERSPALPLACQYQQGGGCLYGNPVINKKKNGALTTGLVKKTQQVDLLRCVCSVNESGRHKKELDECLTQGDF